MTHDINKTYIAEKCAALNGLSDVFSMRIHPDALQGQSDTEEINKPFHVSAAA